MGNKKILFLCLWFFPALLLGQSTGFSYQLILESKGEYKTGHHESSISSDTHLYPIIGMSHEQGKLTTSLQVEGNLSNYNFSSDSVQFLFQELFVRFKWKEQHYFVFGKKRLDWGSGLIWNPTNFYVQKDPFRTQNRLEGIFQMSYTCLLPSGSLQGYIFPENRLKKFSYALKYDYYGSRVDAGLSFLQYTLYQQFGLDISYGGDRFTGYLEGVFRNYSKSYRVGEKGDLILPSTGKNRFWLETAAGINLIINANISLRADYRFREDYQSRKDLDHYRNVWTGYMWFYDPVSISKHTLFLSMEWKDVYDRWSAQARCFYDPLSEQLILSPLLIWKKNNFQVEFSAMIYNNAFSILDFQSSVLLSCHF